MELLNPKVMTDEEILESIDLSKIKVSRTLLNPNPNYNTYNSLAELHDEQRRQIAFQKQSIWKADPFLV